MNRNLRDILILLGAFALLWLIFTIFPIFSTKNLPSVPVKSEEKFGSVIFNNLYNSDNAVIHDPIIDSSIKVISGLLLKQIPDSKYHYHIVVLRSHIVNAFALPGGYIVIFSSLIEATNSPEELAAVLAHEMGHVEKQHVVQKIFKDELLSLLTGGKGYAQKFTNMVSASAFDRKSEAEADDFSLQLLVKSGVSPRHTGDFFKRLKDSVGDIPNVLTIISSHPDLDSRIEKSYSYKLPDNFKEKNISLNWNIVKSVAQHYR